MAHLVETMAYAGQTPWHGLGQQLPSGLPIDDWIVQAGMDWEIMESPVRFIAGQQPYLGEIKPYEDHKVLYRSDTLAPLSVVGQRYNVVQPREILEFYRDLTEQSDFELETAGVLKGGKKLWALAKTGQSTTLKGKDVTKGYVLLATACDGTMATTAQFTSIRVVCNNTLTVAVSDTSGAVKVPHRSAFDASKVKQALGISVSDWDEFMYRMKALSERKVNRRESRNYLLNVLTDTEKGGKTEKNGTTHNPNLSKSEERTLNRTLDLFNGQGMGAALPSAEGTAYGLLNAVTQFIDHEGRSRTQDNRLNSAWFGQGAAIKRKALDQALLLTA
jgi:phage/plasmid-like protein (TIGR03299 family)